MASNLPLTSRINSLVSDHLSPARPWASVGMQGGTSVPASALRKEAIGSVIIPAHNEAAVIERTLRALYADGLAHSFETVLVCNNCSDGTARLARDLGLPIQVIETATPGKVNAIRLGESTLPRLPRIYLDADVTTSGRAIYATLEHLRTGGIAGRPPHRYETSSCSLLAAAYFRAKGRLPGVQSDLCGGGIYGLSDTARSRFGAFPDVTADDLFAARITKPHEIRIIDTDATIVYPPQTLRAIFKVNQRVLSGNRELKQDQSLGVDSTARDTAKSLLAQFRKPAWAFDALIYALVVVAGRLTLKLNKTTRWERDETSR
jgi:hypothetical protein